jgi:hypothetical protein
MWVVPQEKRRIEKQPYALLFFVFAALVRQARFPYAILYVGRHKARSLAIREESSVLPPSKTWLIGARVA